jgi:hypothetical protein
MRIRSVTALAITFMVVFATPALARGPWRAGEANTRGWQLMSPEERIDHQTRVRSFKTYAECREYQLEHHRVMEERARQRGVALREGGRDFCEHLKPRDELP